MKRATVRDYGNDPVSFFRPSHKLSLSFRLDTVLELRDWVSFKKAVMYVFRSECNMGKP